MPSRWNPLSSNFVENAVLLPRVHFWSRPDLQRSCHIVSFLQWRATKRPVWSIAIQKEHQKSNEQYQKVKVTNLWVDLDSWENHLASHSIASGMYYLDITINGMLQKLIKLILNLILEKLRTITMNGLCLTWENEATSCFKK